MHNTNLKTIEKIASQLIQKWLDKSWSFRWDRAKTRLGLCDYQKKTIQLSKPLIPFLKKSDIEDTLLHEIAHALAGAKAGHGPQWKNIAKNLGAKTTRCANIAIQHPQVGARYVLKDKQGNIYRYYHRKPNKTMQHINLAWVKGRKKETLGQLIIEKISTESQQSDS